MSSRRDMRTCGALALTARIAASRFVLRRGNARGRRSPWLPISLRWRQTRRRPDMTRDRRAPSPSPSSSLSSSAGSLWLPQFHLHFAARASDRVRRDERPGFPSAATIREARQIVINRQWTKVRMHALTLRPHRAHGQHVVHAGIAAVPKVHASETAVRPWPLTRPSIVSPAAYRLRTSVVEPIRRGIPAGTSRNGRSHLFQMRTPRTSVVEPIRRGIPAGIPRNERSHLSQTHAPMGRQELRVSRRLPALVDAAGSHSTVRTPSHQGIVRPPELVYRRELRPRTEIAGQPSCPSPAVSSPRSPVRSVAGQEAAPEVSLSGRPAALRVTDLDPAFLDRLTDDVIRRVERRVRIERERRGL
jgi:hypothetical protein